MSRQASNYKRVEAANAAAASLLLTTGTTPQSILSAAREQLLSLQSQLLMGETWGIWEVDPALVSLAPIWQSHRRYRVENALPPGIDPGSKAANRIWSELMRIAISSRLWPSPAGRRSSFSSLQVRLRCLGMLTRKMESFDKPAFWSQISQEAVGDKNGAMMKNCFWTLAWLKDIGAIGDCAAGKQVVAGSFPRRSRIDEPEHTKSEKSGNTWQPFPDSFTAEAGWHAIQCLEILGPALLDALEHSSAVTVPPPSRKTSGKRIRKDKYKPTKPWRERMALDQFINNWEWTAPDDSPHTAALVPSSFSVLGIGTFSWPPNTYAKALSLLNLIQASHLWVLALATAGRHAELLSMKVGSLTRCESDAPTTQMDSWKIDGLHAAARELPLPSLALFALQQQERLAKFVKREYKKEGDHLWVLVTVRSGDPLLSFAKLLSTLVQTYGLQSHLGDSNAHMHRFRKTLVRIVALALVHAPKILMDVLGHKDEQMTVMRYILADQTLLEEINETVRELNVLKVEEVIRNPGSLQGKAAPVFKQRIEAYAVRLGESAHEPQNIREFADAMSGNGTKWACIAPGVYCTGFDVGGLCNKNRGGAPDPHYCHPNCDNQLVISEGEGDDPAVARAIRNVDFLLNELHSASECDEEMLVAQFLGQIKALLGRWREVDRHVSVHPLAKRHKIDLVLVDD